MKGIITIAIMLIGVIFVSILVLTMAQQKETISVFVGYGENLISNPSFTELRDTGEKISNGDFSNNFTDWYSFYGELPNENVSLSDNWANLTYFDNEYSWERLSQNISALTSDNIYNFTFYFKSFNLSENLDNPYSFENNFIVLTISDINQIRVFAEFNINDTNIKEVPDFFDYIKIYQTDMGNNITKINILFSSTSEYNGEMFGFYTIGFDSNESSWFAIDNITLNPIPIPKDWYYADKSSGVESNFINEDYSTWNISHFNLTNNMLFENLNEIQIWCDETGDTAIIKGNNLTLNEGTYYFRFDIKGILNTSVYPSSDVAITIQPNINLAFLTMNNGNGTWELVEDSILNEITYLGENIYRISGSLNLSSGTYMPFIYGLNSCGIQGDSYVFLDNFALQKYEYEEREIINQNPELTASLIGVVAIIVIATFLLINFIKFK